MLHRSICAVAPAIFRIESEVSGAADTFIDPVFTIAAAHPGCSLMFSAGAGDAAPGRGAA